MYGTHKEEFDFAEANDDDSRHQTATAAALQ